MDDIILVDEKDNPIGKMEKLEAHKKKKLHRAFSILVFNAHGDLLIQKRSFDKYHSGGLWSNTCCSHPKPGEDTLDAAHRRLKEEMGFDCPLIERYTYIYDIDFENGLSEYELDHVIFGYHEGDYILNPDEASDAIWRPIKSIKADLEKNPERYTHWFKIIMYRL